MIVTMLSFYDEDRTMVERALEGAAVLGSKVVLACDGAYALFPGGRPRSSPGRIASLSKAAADLDLELMLLQPRQVWEDNEVGKRSAMLQIALNLTGEDDWLLVWDADYELERGVDLNAALPPYELPNYNEAVPRDFASVSFTDGHGDGAHWHPARLLMRARHDLHMRENHYTYYLEDGTYSEILVRDSTAPAASFGDQVRVRHRVHERDPERRAKQTEFYRLRDELGIER